MLRYELKPQLAGLRFKIGLALEGELVLESGLLSVDSFFSYLVSTELSKLLFKSEGQSRSYVNHK